MLQGDGISYETLTHILENMKKHKWSADNIAFGSGGLYKMFRLRYSSEFTVFSFHSFRFKTARVVPYRRTDTVCQTSLYTIRMVCTDGKRWSRSVDGPIKATWIIFMFHSECVEKLFDDPYSLYRP